MIIILLCKQCGKIRKLGRIPKRDLCGSCAAKNRGFVHKSNCKCPFCRDKSGGNNPFYNKHHTEETRKKIYGENSNLYIDGRSSKIYYCIEKDCKKIVDRKGNRCYSCANKGKNNSNYIDGRTPLSTMIRNLEEYKEWRKSVFKRDNYKCVKCDKKRNKKAHHKKPFAEILQEFLNFYNQFSPIEDKETLVRFSLSWEDFWDISNGKTLCEDCHRETKSFRKNLKKVEN